MADGETQHQHENGFDHLEVTGHLGRDYDLGEKFESNTDGQLGWKSDPFLLYYVSFRATSSESRPEGTLHYALSRGFWNGQRAEE